MHRDAARDRISGSRQQIGSLFEDRFGALRISAAEETRASPRQHCRAVALSTRTAA
jgi:hypothetical protein